MRKPFVTLAAAGSLTLVALSTQAQVLVPPVAPAVPVPAPVVAAAPERAPAHLPAEGLLGALRPGQATAFDFVSDDDLDRLLPPGIRSDAWLATYATGRWWVWDDGLALPADRRAEAHQALGAGPR